MNYYPYFSYFPTTVSANAPANSGLISRLFRNGINWGSLINNTQKTLNIINQAIPVVKQVTPVVKNAKTMFSVMNEFKKIDNSYKTSKNSNTNDTKNNYPENNNINDVTPDKTETVGPIFFV